MADGNLGSIWMSLGIKDNVTDSLKKVQTVSYTHLTLPTKA